MSYTSKYTGAQVDSAVEKALSGEAASVSNDNVEINGDGIYIAPTPLDNNNILGGVLGIVEVDASGSITNSRLHPDVGEYAYASVSSDTDTSKKIVINNGSLGYEANEYAVIGTTYQGSYAATGSGALVISEKTSTSFVVSAQTDSGAAFLGGFLIILSTRHLWY